MRAVSFASPWLLPLLLVVPAALVFALWLDRRRSRYAVAFTNLDVLASVAPKRRRPLRWLPLVLFLLALASASAAVARPTAKVSVPSDKATIVLLVDVSGSMRANDVEAVPAGRRAAARWGSSPTRSRRASRSGSSRSRAARTSWSFRRPIAPSCTKGSTCSCRRPEPRSATASRWPSRLRRRPSNGVPRGKDGKVPGAIVLLSDGAQTRGILTPLEGAGRARTAGLRVFTVALGTKNGSLGFNGGAFGFGGGGFGGNGRFPVRPDPVTLAAIAKATDGKAYQAQVGVQGAVDLQAARSEHRDEVRDARGLVVVRRPGGGASARRARNGAHHRRAPPLSCWEGRARVSLSKPSLPGSPPAGPSGASRRANPGSGGKRGDSQNRWLGVRASDSSQTRV